MCKRADCPNLAKGQDYANKNSKLRHWEEVKDDPHFNKALDMMPDGFHAKPYRLWAAKPQKRRLEPSVDEGQIADKREEIRRKWEAIPEPRPSLFDFAAQESQLDAWQELYQISRTALFASDRIKACATLLEHGKSKPKQQIELTKDESVDVDELWRRMLQLKLPGVRTEDVEAALAGLEMKQ